MSASARNGSEPSTPRVTAGGPASPGALDALHGFLLALFADHEEGRERSLAEYQALFPGQEELVAREYAALARGLDPHPSTSPGVRPGRLGPFELESELDGGGQSSVWRARDTRNGKLVALKLLLPLDVLAPRARLRLARESQALASLSHPGICRILESGTHGALPYVVMELVEGESLALRLVQVRGGRAWPLGERLVALEQVCRAVHAVHEAGILHRDIKPGNVMLSRADRPVLVDFGLAKLVEVQGERLTQTGELIGTLAYLPPETLVRDVEFDRRCDVYMLGGLLFECLVLRPPFMAPSRTRLFDRILYDEAPDVRRLDGHIPRTVATVVATALAKDPQRRYANAAALADDLERARLGKAIRARRPSLLQRLNAFRKRRPALAGSLAAALAVTVIGASAATDASLRTARLVDASERAGALRRAEFLRQEAEERLWPVLPERMDDMDRWLREAADTHALLEHERAERADEVLARLAALGAAIETVRARRASAESVALALERSRSEWLRVAAEIAADPRYGGLVIEPQPGLVPLGRDPQSGWMEFAHVQSGAPAVRDAATEALSVGEDTGIVLVLVPGGSFLMGAQMPQAGRPLGEPNVDAQATDGSERPIHAVQVAPFFLGKYELTQGQWLRLAGDNPSRFYPGSDAHDPITLAHPVENVSWRMSSTLLAHFALGLPTEEQWEYAARAGTGTPWSTGATRETLAGAANLADRSSLRAGFHWPELNEWPEFEDGHVEHAAVGSLRANPWGFHDVHGNVWEFCHDVWRFYEGSLFTQVVYPGRVRRGGGFYDSAWLCRSSVRMSIQADERIFATGVRVARGLHVTGSRP